MPRPQQTAIAGLRCRGTRNRGGRSMKSPYSKAALSVTALSIVLLSASASMAAPEPAQGDTSGPAAGTRTTPSTAVQKNSATGTTAGAPGVEGKPGAESGAQPKPAVSSDQPPTRNR